VAKLVDALCSGRSVRKDVLVRIQSWAQDPLFKGAFLLSKFHLFSYESNIKNFRS
jgi:hypothetical protein